MELMRTVQGFAMNRRLRGLIVEAYAETPDATLAMIAERIGAGKRTVGDYLTDEVRRDIEARRKVLEQGSLDDVDRAMMRQACKGNVAAARLVYMRMTQKGEIGPLPSLDEMEAELVRLRGLENMNVTKGDE